MLIETVRENLLKICIELENISVDLLKIRKSICFDTLMAATFIDKQLDLLDAIVLLEQDSYNKSNASYILVRAMLEMMAQLYYATIDKKHSTRWANHDCVGLFIAKVKMYDFRNKPMPDKEIKQIIESLKKRGNCFVNSKDKPKVKEALDKGILPSPEWYNPYWHNKSISAIIRSVEKAIFKRTIENQRKTPPKRGFPMLYQYICSQVHPSSTGFHNMYDIKGKCLTRIDSLDIKPLIIAIETMLITLEVSNNFLNGIHKDEIETINENFFSIINEIEWSKLESQNKSKNA